ncbi:MAG: hypothetical protein ACOCQA_01895 [bacterium]
MYKPNFDTSLKFDKVLELLNKLAEHNIHIEPCGEAIGAFVINLTDEAKNFICNLGVSLNELDENFYNKKEEWFDLVPIWDDIQTHYSHELYYTGEEFIVKDIEKEELLEKLIKCKEHLKHYSPCECNTIENGILCENCQLIKELENAIRKTEGYSND